MQKTLRLLVDRRSGEDRRKIYNQGYFRLGGDERRTGKERRTTEERRKDWIRMSVWSSTFKGFLDRE
jgi:hypothetical protein